MVYCFFRKKNISVIFATILILFSTLFTTGCGNSGCRTIEEQYYGGVWEHSDDVKVKPINNNVIEQESSVGAYILRNGVTESLSKEHRWYKLRNVRGEDLMVKAGQMVQLTARGNVILTGFSQTINLTMNDWIGLNGANFTTPGGIWYTKQIQPNTKPSVVKVSIMHKPDGKILKNTTYTVVNASGQVIDIPIVEIGSNEKIYIDDVRKTAGILKEISNCDFNNAGQITSCDRYSLTATDACVNIANVEEINYMWYFIKRLKFKKWFDKNRNIIDREVIINSPICKVEGNSSIGIWYVCDFKFEGENFQYRRINKPINSPNFSQFEDQVISTTHQTKQIGDFPGANDRASSDNSCDDYTKDECISKIRSNSNSKTIQYDEESLKKHYVFCVAGGKNGVVEENDSACSAFQRSGKFNHIIVVEQNSPIEVVFKTGSEIGLTKTKTFKKGDGQTMSKYCRYLPKRVKYNLHKYRKNFGWDESSEFCREECRDLCIDYFHLQNNPKHVTCSGNDCYFKINNAIDLTTSRTVVDFNDIHSEYKEVKLTDIFDFTKNNNQNHRNAISSVCNKGNDSPYGAGWYGLYARRVKDDKNNNDNKESIFYIKENQNFTIVKYDYYEKEKQKSLTISTTHAENKTGDPNYICYHCCTCTDYNCIYIGDYNDELKEQLRVASAAEVLNNTSKWYPDYSHNCFKASDSSVSTNTKPKLFNYTPFQDVKFDVDKFEGRNNFGIAEKCPGNCAKISYIDDGECEKCNIDNYQETILSTDYRQKIVQNEDIRKGGKLSSDINNTASYKINNGETYVVGEFYDNIVDGYLPIHSPEIEEIECYYEDLPIDDSDLFQESIKINPVPDGCYTSGAYQEYQVETQVGFNTDAAGIFPIKWAGYTVKPGFQLPITISSENPALIRKIGVKDVTSVKPEDYMELKSGHGLMVYLAPADEEPGAAKYSDPDMWQCNMGMGGSYGYYRPYKYQHKAGKLNNPREIATPNNLWWFCDDPVPMWFSGYDYVNIKTTNPVNMHVYYTDELKRYLPGYIPQQVDFGDTVETLGCNERHVPTVLTIDGKSYSEGNIKLAYDNTEGAMYQYRESINDAYKSIEIGSSKITSKEYSPFSPKIIQVTFKDNNDKSKIYENVSIKAVEYKIDAGGNETSEVKNFFNNLVRTYDKIDGRIVQAYYEFDYSDGHHKIKVEDKNVVGDASCVFSVVNYAKKADSGALSNIADYQFKENDAYYSLNGNKIFTRFGPFIGMHEDTSGILFPAIFNSYGMCRGNTGDNYTGSSYGREFIYDTHKVPVTFFGVGYTDRRKVDHWFRLEFTTPEEEDGPNIDGDNKITPKVSRCHDTSTTWTPCSSVNLTIPDILLVDLAKTNNALVNGNRSLSGTVILYKDYNNITLSKKKYYLITHKDSICDIDWNNYILDKDDIRINKIEKDGRINVDDDETGIRIHLMVDGKECVLDDNEDGTTISTVQERYILNFIYQDGIFSIERENISYDTNAAVCFSVNMKCNGYLKNYITAGRFETTNVYYDTEDLYDSYAFWLFDKCYEDFSDIENNTNLILNCILEKSGANNYSLPVFEVECVKDDSSTDEKTRSSKIEEYKILTDKDSASDNNDITTTKLESMCEDARKYGISKSWCMRVIMDNPQVCHTQIRTKVITESDHIYGLDKAPYVLSCAPSSKEKGFEYKMPYSTKLVPDNETNFTSKNDGLVLRSNIPTIITNQYFARCVADWHTPRWMLMQRPGDPTSFYHGFDLLSGAYITDSRKFTAKTIKDKYAPLWAGYGGMVTNAVFNVSSEETELAEGHKIKGHFKVDSVEPINAEFKAVYPRQFIMVKPIINDPINTSDDNCNIVAAVNNVSRAHASFSMNEPFNNDYPSSVLAIKHTSKSRMEDRKVEVTENDDEKRTTYVKYYADREDTSYTTINGNNSERGNFFKDSEMSRNWVGAGVLRPYWHVLKDGTGRTHVFNKDEIIKFNPTGSFYVSGNLSLEDQPFCVVKGSVAYDRAITGYAFGLYYEVQSAASFIMSGITLITHAAAIWQGWPGAIAGGFAAGGFISQTTAIGIMEGAKEAAEDDEDGHGGAFERGKIKPEKPSYAKRQCGVGTAFRVVPVPPFACLSEYKYHCNNSRIDYKVWSSSTSDSIEDLCVSTGVPSWQSDTDLVGACIKKELRIKDNLPVREVAQKYSNRDKKLNSLIDAPTSNGTWDELENVFQSQCGVCAKTSSIYTYGGIHYYIDSEDPKELMDKQGLYNNEHCAQYVNEDGDTYAFYTDITYIKPISSYTSKQKKNIQEAILTPLKNKMAECDASYVINSNLDDDKYTKMWQNAFLKAQIRNSASSVSQLLSIYTYIISESTTTKECQEAMIDKADIFANIAYDSMLAIIEDVSGDTYNDYYFDQNILSASCSDNKKGQGGLGITPDVSMLTSFKSITRFDQENILANEGYGELIQEFAVDSGENSLILNIPNTLFGKPFKRAKIGFTFAGTNNEDPMYLYKEYRRVTQEDLDRGYTITIGSTAQVANGKYLYFYIQPLTDQGLPDESYNPNVIFSPSKTEYGNDYYIAQNDMVYSFKNYDPDDDGVITFTSPRSGKLWFIILDSEELAGEDADADGKMIEFSTDQNDGDVALRVEDDNVLATNAGYYLVNANVQVEGLDSLTGDDSNSGSAINTIITRVVVDNIKLLFLGKYQCEDKNGKRVCNYKWEDGILGQVAMSFFKIHILYIAWFLLVVFTMVILSFQILLGQKKFDFKFTKDYIIRYALIMAFVNPNSLELYCRLFVNSAFNLAEGLSAYVAGAFNSSKYDINEPNTFINVAFGPVDQILKFWVNKYTFEKMLAIIFSSWPGIIVFVLLILCFILFIINIIEAVILYIVILIKMSLYLSVGPIVFLLLIHEKTAGKFTDWWKTIAGCIAEQVCMFAALSFFANVYYHILKGSMNFIYCWEPVLKIPILDITIFSMWKISGTMPTHMAELTGSIGEETAVNTKGFNFLTAFMLFILTAMMSKFVSKASTFGAGLFGQESSMPEKVKQITEAVKGKINLTGVKDGIVFIKNVVSNLKKAKKGEGEGDEGGENEGSENRGK